MKRDPLEEELRGGTVSRETLRRFELADADNCTASIGWLSSHLEVLERTVSRSAVRMETDSGSVILTTPAEFAQWCRKTFPHARGSRADPAPDLLVSRL